MKNRVSIAVFVAIFCWAAWAAGLAKGLDVAMQLLQNRPRLPTRFPFPAQPGQVHRGAPTYLTGLIVNGEHGGGAVSCRAALDGSAPALSTFSGGSVGLQADAEHQHVVLLN
jgi:hypothetical protein